MATTADYLDKLVTQKNALADNLVTKGVTATHDETLETLVPKVLEISGGSGGNGIYPIGEDGYPYGDVVIPEGVTSISSESDNTQRKSCFYANANVNSVKLPSSMQTLGDYGFEYSSIIDVIFNEKSNVTKIGTMCFYGCAKLKSIFIPAKVSSIGMYAFYNCAALTSAVFEEGSQITEIPMHLFDGCTSLTDVAIPTGVTTLGAAVFYNCSKMTHISLPNTITSMVDTPSSNSNTFYNCTALETVDLEQDFNCNIAINFSTVLTNAAEMLTKLKDLTGETAKTITFAKAVYDSLTADEIAVATNKNWTVASY